MAPGAEADSLFVNPCLSMFVRSPVLERVGGLNGPDYVVLRVAHRMPEGPLPKRLEPGGAARLLLAPFFCERASFDIAAQNFARALPHLIRDKHRSAGQRAILAG